MGIISGVDFIWSEGNVNVPELLSPLLSPHEQQTSGFQFCAIISKDYRGFHFTAAGHFLVQLFILSAKSAAAVFL